MIKFITSLLISLSLTSTAFAAPSIFDIFQGGTGTSTFSQGWIYSSGGNNFLQASTSPTVNYITATSTTGISIFPNASTTNISATTICFIGDSCRTAWPTGGGGGSDTNWSFFNGSGIRLATTTNQVVIGASATTSLSKFQVTGGATIDNGTTTNATSTNLFATIASTTQLFTNQVLVGTGTLSSFDQLVSTGDVDTYALTLSNNNSAGSNPWRISATGAGWSAGDNRLVIVPPSSTISATALLTLNGLNRNVGISTTSPYAPLSVVGTGGIVAESITATSTTATSSFNGSVGIGTSTPRTPLDVYKVPSSGERSSVRFGLGGHLLSTDPSMASFTGGMYWNGANWIAEDTGASGFQMYNANKGDFSISTNGGLTAGSSFVPSPRFVITNGGNVGLGGNITDYSALTGSVLTINSNTVGVGSTTPFGALGVVGTTTIKGNLLVTRTGEVPTYNDANLSLIDVIDNIDSYLYIGLQNKSNGTFASSDIVWCGDNCTTTTYYSDIGRSNSNYSDPAYASLGGANIAYWYNTDAGVTIGVGTTTADADFKIVMGNLSNAPDVFHIKNQTGNVGISTTSPYAKLSVAGETVAQNFTATSTTVDSVFPLFTSTNGTTTFATSTNFFATKASTTDIFVGNSLEIGTSTGNSRLEIFNNTSVPALSIDAGVTGNDIFRIYRGGLNGGTGAGMALTAPSNSPQFQFRTGLSSLPGGSGVGTTRAVVSYDSPLGAFVIATSSIASGAIGIEPFIIKNTSSNVGLAGTSTPWGSVSINGSYQSAGEPTFVVGSSTKTDLVVYQSGITQIATTTTSLRSLFNLGFNPGTTNASTTISTGKLQFSGYNTAGSPICMYVVGTTPTVTSGACNN